MYSCQKALVDHEAEFTICHYLLRCVHAHKTADLVGEHWLPALKQTDLVDHMV